MDSERMMNADWMSRRKEIQSRVLKTLGSFPPASQGSVHRIRAAPPPRDRQSYVRHHVQIAGDSPTDWITAWLLIPTHLTGPTPAVICCHPTTEGAGKNLVAGISGASADSPPEPSRSYGLELAADWGFITICPDMVHDGERLNPGEKSNDSRRFYHEHPDWSIVGKYVQDLRRVVDFLVEHEEVDSSAIGIIGHSLGSHSAIFASAMDERIKVCVANGGTHCWIAEGERSHWCVGDTEDGRSWKYIPKAAEFLHQDPLEAPFSFAELTSLIAPRPLLITMTENGSRKQRIPEFMAQLQQDYQALGAEEQLDSATYASGHGFPVSARLRAYQWLRNHLPLHTL